MNQKTNRFNGLGTPKDIDEMIVHILCYRPPHNVTPQDWLHGILRDYLAQKFNVAMLKAHTPEQEAALNELWVSIVGDDGVKK